VQTKVRVEVEPTRLVETVLCYKETTVLGLIQTMNRKYGPDTFLFVRMRLTVLYTHLSFNHKGGYHWNTFLSMACGEGEMARG
jgi:hypothetical protein